jgi:glycerol-3-phosphate dehydrogenase
VKNHALDLRNRAALFGSLEGQVFDVVVIGGGITGAGIARDAAMRGLSVALVEARDFASGTSSRSSKLIHGGLRYLAQGDLALVREAASERKIVETIAPFLARETPFIIPARNAGAVAKLRAGLWTFEKLGGVAAGRKHEMWSVADLKAREPAIRTDGLIGAIVYPEFITDDARLTLANIRSAAAAGAIVASYAPVRTILIENGRAAGVEVVEALPGAEERVARLAARMVVNAAGPWVDAVRALEASDAPPRLSLTRGVHLVVPRARLPISRTVILTAADRRGVFAVPRGEITYLGTTDTFYPDAETWPPITTEDADYLFAAAADRFSSAPLTYGDLISVWAGVRPLIAEPGKSASDISRKDELWTGPAGVLSIAGGKLTAYRRMAERVVDAVETGLGHKPQASRTADEALIGGDADLSSIPGGTAAQAAYAVTHEGALTLEDYWVRRSSRAWFDPDAGLSALVPAAAAMAPLLGWSDDRQAAEIAACRTIRNDDMKAFLPPPPREGQDAKHPGWGAVTLPQHS